MKQNWLFYPENDIALANGPSHFTAPPAAVQLRRSGEMLPMWLGEAGDSVICSGVNAEWLDTMRSNFGIDIDVWRQGTPGRPTPWGWSYGARRLLVNAGVPEEALPGDAWLDGVRQLSHRRTATVVAELANKTLTWKLLPAAQEFTDMAALQIAVTAWGCDFVVKTPWSSSGRGVYFAYASHPQPALQPAAGSIRRHGSVMAERFVPDATDFALLYEADEPGRVRFVGYSLFQTQGGRYTGNYVEPQLSLRSRITALLGDERLDELQDAVAQSLEKVIEGYAYYGPIGVDLLVTPAGDVHLSEINFRYTMGFVAMRLERFTAGPALFCIERAGMCPTTHTIDNHRLTSGTLALTPPGGDFDFLLSVRRASDL